MTCLRDCSLNANAMRLLFRSNVIDTRYGRYNSLNSCQHVGGRSVPRMINKFYTDTNTFQCMFDEGMAVLPSTISWRLCFASRRYREPTRRDDEPTSRPESSSGRAGRVRGPACWPPSPLRAGSFVTRDYPPARMPSSNYCRAGATSMESGRRSAPPLWHALRRLAICQAWAWERVCIDHGEFSIQEGLVF